MIEKELRDNLERIMKTLPCIDSAILPALQLIQESHGFISEVDMEELAKILNFPEARIFSAASFYSMLKLKPKGRYHIQVCTNVSCSLLEKESLYDYISEKLGISHGEHTRDNLFSLEPVECLGSCGYAPAMIINSDHYEGLDFAKVDEIINEIKEKK